MSCCCRNSPTITPSSQQNLGLLTGAPGTFTPPDPRRVEGGNVQLRYLSESLHVDRLNGGRGVAAGKIKITDRSGMSSVIDLSQDDMVRACRIAATEALRHSDTPRELDSEYLRGVLVREADKLKFMNDANTAPVDPAAVVDMLVTCGVLNRNRTNRRVQFAYDPVAEQLKDLNPGRSSTNNKRRATRPSNRP